jgi:hypothetical protein
VNQVEEDAMYAEVGDELLGPPRGCDEDREGMIIENHGENSAPPYLVRWKDGHETVFTPSSDTHVEHRPATQRPSG